MHYHRSWLRWLEEALTGGIVVTPVKRKNDDRDTALGMLFRSYPYEVAETASPDVRDGATVWGDHRLVMVGGRTIAGSQCHDRVFVREFHAGRNFTRDVPPTRLPKQLCNPVAVGTEDRVFIFNAGLDDDTLVWTQGRVVGANATLPRVGAAAWDGQVAYAFECCRDPVNATSGIFRFDPERGTVERMRAELHRSDVAEAVWATDRAVLFFRNGDVAEYVPALDAVAPRLVDAVLARAFRR